VNDARNQCLIGHAVLGGLRLQQSQIAARDPDVHPLVFGEGISGRLPGFPNFHFLFGSGIHCPCSTDWMNSFSLLSIPAIGGLLLSKIDFGILTTRESGNQENFIPFHSERDDIYTIVCRMSTP
jgi:hypothetical protein